MQSNQNFNSTEGTNLKQLLLIKEQQRLIELLKQTIEMQTGTISTLELNLQREKNKHRTLFDIFRGEPRQ